jgi:hypothetical protein
MLHDPVDAAADSAVGVNGDVADGLLNVGKVGFQSVIQ